MFSILPLKGEKLIYNAAADISNSAGSATDVLRKAPMVTVGADGEVKMRGNSNIKVLLNGLPSGILAKNLKGALKMIPASSIESIEVITTPSAKKETQKTGELRRLHTEAKIMELLICQLEQFQKKDDDPKAALKEVDIEKLEQARSLLENNFVNPPTQKELAMAVALNESKLRRGFKDYFGTTIYEYIIRLRMNYARYLLLVEKKNIQETAELSGFSHQNNFSSAFKKYYGISPSEIRL